ncbi:MAG: di-trans,poly-cis-decaprenylcistransferase [Synergistaceae bacterium]|nr:di-trans,poly-cis-decaprenylcistransferase [Synergistaceae bacterium]MBQ7068375.1 di-trans,poly-cis-decaprenylcistransferase [Synergistaceae bacterium]MBR0253277.1 di-trans,poly-cis-decaprenylcistransferase [Synergistaceae bacterium]
MSLTKIPKHLAIILDGNGRWAKKRNLPRLMGHRAGLRKLENMVRLVKRYGIRYFSVYAFSTENWNRPTMEVTGLMSLFRYYIRKKVDEIKSEGARIRFCGRKDRIPEDLLTQMKWAEDYTKDQNILDFILCINYGGRAEILDAVNSFITSNPNSKITEEDLRRNFYLPDVPDPDLIIRTSGELRLSNFWLWESAYSEYYFTDTYWPDFDENELRKALEDFAGRDRRYGGLKS